MRNKDTILLEQAYKQILESGYVHSNEIEKLFNSVSEEKFINQAVIYYTNRMEKYLDSNDPHFKGLNIKDFISLVIKELHNIKELPEKEIINIVSGIKDNYEKHLHSKELDDEYEEYIDPETGETITPEMQKEMEEEQERQHSNWKKHKLGGFQGTHSEHGKEWGSYTPSKGIVGGRHNPEGY